MESTDQYTAAGIRETQDSTLAALEAMPDQELQAMAEDGARDTGNSLESAEETAIRNLQNVFNMSLDENTLDNLKTIILDIEPEKSSRDLTDDVFNLLYQIEEMPADEKITLTAGQIQKMFEAQNITGQQIIVTELLRFYSMFFPDEKRTIFQLVQIIGFITQNEKIRRHREETAGQ